ncbi:MAG: 50S ribosomal protein L24 [Ignavibacteriae bacterium]|nr:50S ribosomal protein L24 [Ignavibacteriota bacterium]
MRVKKEDNVIVISGNFKGKSGKILKVFPKKDRVIVEGVNLRKRHTKANQKNPQGGIIEKEAPIHSSNVMLLDPKTNKPSRIGKKIIIDDKTGKKRSVRVSKSSGEMLS